MRDFAKPLKSRDYYVVFNKEAYDSDLPFDACIFDKYGSKELAEHQCDTRNKLLKTKVYFVARINETITETVHFND